MPRLLRLDGERRGESPNHRSQQEAAAVHQRGVSQILDIDAVAESPDPRAMLLADLADFVTRHRPCGLLTGDALSQRRGASC